MRVSTVQRVDGEDVGIVCFLGAPTKVSPYSYAEELCRKFNTAYGMIPDGAVVVPEHKIGAVCGKLMGGILHDSLKTVYGVAGKRSLHGFDCSVFWIPTKAELDNLLVRGGFGFGRKEGGRNA